MQQLPRTPSTELDKWRFDFKLFTFHHNFFLHSLWLHGEIGVEGKVPRVKGESFIKDREISSDYCKEYKWGTAKVESLLSPHINFRYFDTLVDSTCVLNITRDTNHREWAKTWNLSHPLENLRELLYFGAILQRLRWFWKLLWVDSKGKLWIPQIE